MDLWVLAIVAIALIGLGAWWWARQRAARTAATMARSKRARNVEALDTLMAWTPQPTRILTSSERQAYAVLRRAVPEHIVFAQVPLARFLKVPTRHSYSEWLRRVGHLCADFVVCDPETDVIAVVEVRTDDTQESDRTRRRHARMDRVLRAAGVPLHVWPEGRLPSASAAREALLETRVVLSQEEGPASVALGRAPTAQAPASPAGDGAPRDGWRDTAAAEPPSSTWFDDLDSTPMPLTPARRP